MYGLKFRLNGLYFTTFRVPTSTSLIFTYLIPPYTTIRGLISNALGLPRDDLRVQDWFKIGIKPLHIEKSREMAKILKFKGGEKKFLRKFPSSPVFKEFLVEPSYEIFIVGEKDKIEKVYLALLNPKRPLYLGGSDELVDLDIDEPVEVEEIELDKISSVVEGVYEGCVVQKVPYKFIKRRRTFNLEYKIVSIPMGVIINKKIKGIKFHKTEDFVVVV